MNPHNPQEAKRRAPPKRRSSSYPPQYAKLLLHVASTNTPITINTLANNKSSYTTLRARINEFRRAYYDEAMAENDAAKLMFAEQMYVVTLKNPEQVAGIWQMVITPRETQFAQAIDDMIPDQLKLSGMGEREEALKEKPVQESETANLISKLYREEGDA